MLDGRWKRWAAWTIGALGGLLVLGVAVLHLPQTRQYVLRRAADLLREQGISFDAARFDYNLLELDATLTNVAVRSAAAPDLPPLLQLDEARVNFSLRKLVQGAYYIEDAQIRNPRLNLVIDRDGRDNIPRPPKRKESKSHLDYLIDQLQITGGSLRYEDRRQQFTAELPLRELTIDGNPVTRIHDVRLTSGPGGRLELQERVLAVNALTAAVLLGRDTAEVRRLNLALGDSAIALRGTLKSFDDPAVDFRAETTLALGSLVRFAGVKQRVDGTVRIALSASGPMARLQARARVEGDDLSVERFDRVGLRGEAVYVAEASRVRLESLNLTSPSGSVAGQADLALNAAAGRSTAKLSARNMDLVAISRTLRLPARIASRASADVNANWPGLAFEQAAGAATVRLTATRPAPAARIIPVSGAVSARAQGRTVVVDVAGVRALDATARGRVSLIDRRSLRGDLGLEAPDLNSTIAGAEAYLGKAPGALIGTPIRGAAAITASLGGTVQSPAVDARLSAPDLSAGALEGIGLNAHANYTASRVAIENLEVGWRGQTLSASGTIGLAGPDPALDLSAETDGVTIETILAGLGRSDIPAAGSIRLKAEVGGTTRHPQAAARVAATGLVAYDEKLGQLDLEARLQDRVAQLSGLALRKPQPGGEGTLRASGTYDLDSRAYTVQAESRGLRLVSLILPGATPVRASLELRAHGQGTAENPSLDVRFKADDVAVQERPLGAIELTSKVANQKADIKLEAPRFGITAAADLGTRAPYPASFTVRADQTDFATLPLTLNPQLAGTVSATLRGSGDLQNFRQGEASAEVPNLDIKWRGQPIRAEQPVRLRYSNQVLWIDQAVVAARESRISVKGQLPLDPTGAGAIELSAKLDLPSLARYIPADKPIEAQGQAAIDGAIRGNLKRIDPNITVSLAGGSLSVPGQEFPVSAIDLQAAIANGALELRKASVQFGPASLAASGTVPFALLPADLPVELPRRQGPAQIAAELKSLDLATLPNAPEELAGTVSARLNVEAPRADLQGLRGTLAFPELRVGVGTYAIEQRGVSEIRFENGTARVTRFELTGPETEIRLAGTAGLTGARPLDLRLDGKLDASIASAFTDAVRVSGATEIQAAVTGTAEKPEARGHVQLSDGQLSVERPRIGAERLNLRLDLQGQRLALSRLDGSLNGGALSGGGTIEFGGPVPKPDLNLKAQYVYLDFPQGLKTVSNIALTLRNIDSQIVAGGDVSILEGGFTDDLYFDRGILAALTASRQLDLTQERSALIEKVRLSVGVRTEEPLVIDNNLARAEITADLRVVGTPYEPGLSGRVEIADDGELRFQERRYVVERGVITFTNERRIEPSLDIIANTSAGGYDVRLQVSGELGDTKTTLTSDPSLPEPDILALLITGKTMEEMRGEEFAVASNQVLSYLTGRVGSQLGRGLQRATGLSTVRIEPNLIAAETDPSARLTVGQDITRNVELIYSMDLVNSSDQIYVAEYDISKRFTARGVRQSEGSFRFDFRHDLRFGGLPEPRRGARRTRARVGQVAFTGETYFPEKQLADKFNVGSSDRYDFFKIRKGLDRVNKLYAREGLLEAAVRLNRQQRNGTVDLTVDVKPGPKVEFVFEGIAVPDKVRERVRDVWRGGVFDLQRAEESKVVIREWLVRERYLQSVIHHSILQPTAASKRVLFDIQTGPRFSGVAIAFEGARQFDSGKLRDIIDDQKMSIDVYTRPGRVSEMLTRFYHEKGYLDAEVGEPEYELNAQSRTGRVVFPVAEGPLYRVGRVEFEGNTVFTDARLAEAVPLPRGEGYRPVLREHALQRLKDLYWDQGYNDVEAEFALSRNPENGTVDIAFRIVENRKSVTREVVVEGNQNTSDNLIQTQLEIQPGDPLSLQKLGTSRRNLYRTGAYSLVDILREPVGGADLPGGEAPVRLRVKVREVQPFQLRYGAFYDTERGPGAIVDFSNRNSLGSARQLGLRARYDSQLREGRIYFSQPLLRRFPLKTIASPYWRQERNPATQEVDPFNVDRVGFSLQQEAALRNHYLLTYGYRIERSRTYDPGPEPIFDIPLRVASLTSTLSRETRDEILDATRGSFLSHAIQFSPELLGSQVRFIKYFGQYFRYFALQRPRIELFTNEVLRPRLVYAVGARVGVARGFGGQEVPLSERFFAGGGTTIRGFEQNSVGPVGADRKPRGGEAMFVLNNELRFPLVSMFDGVGFVDIGNVYPTVRDFSLGDIRKAAGLGLRVRTPWFLLRLDYGLKLDRRPGESLGRLFFSIGQAF